MDRDQEIIKILKTINPDKVKIGDLVTYSLSVTVPKGTKAYNVQVCDSFPYSTQSYIIGSATKDGVPIIPSLDEGSVVFPEIPLVDATVEDVVIIYTFSIRVTNANHIYPFVDIQLSNAWVSWTIDESGTQFNSVKDSIKLEVEMPNLIGIKEQRNISKEGSFRVQNVQYDIGDVIEYRITIINNGAEIGFNSVITDILDSFLTFNEGTIITTIGTANEVNGTITWDIPMIDAGETAVLTFMVTILSGVVAGDMILNSTSYIYKSNNNGFEIIFEPDASNIVRLNNLK